MAPEATVTETGSRSARDAYCIQQNFQDSLEFPEKKAKIAFSKVSVCLNRAIPPAVSLLKMPRFKSEVVMNDFGPAVGQSEGTLGVVWQRGRGLPASLDQAMAPSSTDYEDPRGAAGWPGRWRGHSGAQPSTGWHGSIS